MQHVHLKTKANTNGNTFHLVYTVEEGKTGTYRMGYFIYVPTGATTFTQSKHEIMKVAKALEEAGCVRVE